MSEGKNKKVKQSFIKGSLISSAGVFISKLVGLFYIVPFRAIVGQSNMTFYSAAYDYYNVLLQICSAGLPFAIAAIVAKYMNREDYKSALLVRSLSAGILMVSGFVMSVIFILLSKPLAMQSLGPQATAQDLATMQNTFVILSLALFLVPILYSYRGFYQGMKEMRLYANSQVIEQVGRVAFLLGIGWLVVFVMKAMPIMGIYVAVLGTSVGCILAILYFMAYDRKKVSEIKALARQQESKAEDMSVIIKEMIAFGIPYVIVSILGNSQILVNTNFFVSVNTSLGMDYETAKIIYSIIQTNCDKLTSIPQVLSIGFSAGIVPYMTVSFENRDWKGLNRSIEDCLDTVLFIGLPICFTMAVLSGPVYYIMYGAEELEYGAICLKWAGLLGLMTTLTPICNSMMLTLRFRKESIAYLGVGFIVKCATFYPLIKYTGYIGATTSSVLCSATVIFLSLTKIKNKFDVRYGRIAKRAFRMCIACLAMNGVYVLMYMAGFHMTDVPRLTALLQFAITGSLGLLAYLFVADLMGVPKAVFHMDLRQMLMSVLHRG